MLVQEQVQLWVSVYSAGHRLQGDKRNTLMAAS